MSWWVYMVLFVVGGNLVIHLAVKRDHRKLRAELAPSRILFDDPAASGSYTATAMFGFRWTSFRGELTVHERCLVIYQRGLIAQPALVCFPTEATARGGGLNAIALTASPTVEGSDVVLVGAGRMTVKYKIRLSTTRPKELAASIEKMRHRVVEASPYRSPAG